jgi:hypothetical protein
VILKFASENERLKCQSKLEQKYDRSWYHLKKREILKTEWSEPIDAIVKDYLGNENLMEKLRFDQLFWFQSTFSNGKDMITTYTKERLADTFMAPKPKLIYTFSDLLFPKVSSTAGSTHGTPRDIELVTVWNNIPSSWVSELQTWPEILYAEANMTFHQ